MDDKPPVVDVEEAQQDPKEYALAVAVQHLQDMGMDFNKENLLALRKVGTWAFDNGVLPIRLTNTFWMESQIARAIKVCIKIAEQEKEDVKDRIAAAQMVTNAAKIHAGLTHTTIRLVQMHREKIGGMEIENAPPVFED